MVTVQVKVESGHVYQSVKKLVDDAIPGIVNAEIEGLMLEAQKAASGNYPRGSVQGYNVPLRRGQKYIRTGRYGRGFVVVKTGYKTKRAYSLINPVPYAPYVGGNASGQRQAKIHAGRWPLIASAVNQQAIKLTDQINTRIKKAIRAEGMGL